MIQKTTAATLDYAALLAQAARVLQQYEAQLPHLADSCILHALKAWNWAEKNNTVIYQQPSDISTGTYGDTVLVDEWFWASCELYLTTREPRFEKAVVEFYKPFGVPTWDNVGILGVLSLLKEMKTTSEPIKNTGFETHFVSLVNDLILNEVQSPFQISIDKFAWGSNSDVANIGVLKLAAFNHTGDITYRKSALNDLDYLLGRNATGYCFVTGFGSKSPMNIHHRPSGADTIPEPVPGFLAGGPNTVVMTDCGDSVVRSPYPAKSYVDMTCSYSTNEIAINWNAPLVYLLNGFNNSSR